MGDHAATQLGSITLDQTLPDRGRDIFEDSTMTADTTGSGSESDITKPIKTREEVDEKRRDGDVLNLARRFTAQSQKSIYQKNPFEAGESPILDPRSPNFSPRAFAKSLLNLQSQDSEKWKRRTAGFAFKDLNVYGFGSATDYQKSVGNIFFEAVTLAKKLLGANKPRRIDILQNLDGLVREGEMLVVLGPPGRSVLPKEHCSQAHVIWSGCSTLLKTVAGETNGFYIDDKSYINYQGIGPEQMHKDFRGEAIYTAEVDVHFPMLTVGQTLGFAAQARAPRNIPGGISRQEYSTYLRDVAMAMFGISHTKNTRVGNDFVRGVSGGERKRVTIAEAALSGAPLQCWDNSTRGLDSANAIEFCKTLRMSTDLVGTTAVVAIYQAPQSAYDVSANIHP
jgi:ABC-type multidrug transport system ATPase subunit